jgi:hypothetical protein
MFFLPHKHISASAVCSPVTSLPRADKLLDRNTHLFTYSLSHRLPLFLNPNIHNNHHPSTPSISQTQSKTQYNITQPPTRLPRKKPNRTHSPKMASTNLTDNDRKLLAAAWHCFETQPKVIPPPSTVTIPPSKSTPSSHTTSSQ